MPGPLRIGTRGSALALAQSGRVAEALTAATGRAVELVTIRSEGDDLAGPLTALGTTGVFATRLRLALLAEECDLLVHSYKDLPVESYPGLEVVAVPRREDPRDVLCGSTLAALRPGARVGSGSPRRAAALLRRRPDLELVPIRGNVDTRLGRLAGPDPLDAVVLAAAGLARLGRLDAIAEHLDPEVSPPAPAQGALAIEAVAGSETAALAAVLDDPATSAAVAAERAVLAELQAGCTAPIGALATAEGSTLALTAVAIAPSGVADARVRRFLTLPGARIDRERAAALGREAAGELRDLLRADPALADLVAG